VDIESLHLAPWSRIVIVFNVFVSAGSIMVRNYHRKLTRGLYSAKGN